MIQTCRNHLEVAMVLKMRKEFPIFLKGMIYHYRIDESLYGKLQYPEYRDGKGGNFRHDSIADRLCYARHISSEAFRREELQMIEGAI
jgi:hypothetical protein